MIGLRFKTRRITRAGWKVIWRQLRIVNRETRRAQADILVFGTGFIQIGPDIPDFIRCVPPAGVLIGPDGTPELRA